jgi:hypothetical protein
MRDLIYLSLPWLSIYDPELLDARYPHHEWFYLKNIEHWPPHTVSRVHQLDTPWPMSPTVIPMPRINNSELDFGRVIESIAEQFCKHATQSGKKVYVCWSGGIDSTSILVSLLKVASAEFLKNLTVLHSTSSVIENGYFFSQFIEGKLQTENIDTFSITADNYDKIIVVDGEAGNQVMGQTSIHKLIYAGRLDLLNQDWRTIKDMSQLLIGVTDFAMDFIKESIKYSPVPIETGCDFIWWTNFNFKFDDVLLRKALNYTQHLTAEQSKLFYEQGLYRFYVQPEMQIWSMLTKDLRRESSRHMPKYIPKKYIFDFDRNDFYFSNKSEEGSSSQVFFNQDVGTNTTGIFALDKEWNKHNIAEQSVRVALGKILQKNQGYK